MPKIIVQGIPLNRTDPTKLKLETLFQKYCSRGSVKCLYLWSETRSFTNLSRVHDNFAIMKFNNNDDAKRVYDAAVSKDIKLDGVHVLTVTKRDSSVTIGQLADCLQYIFSMLDMESKLAAGKVCKQWQSIVARTVNRLDLSEKNYQSRTEYRKILRYGKYLTELTCSVKTSPMLTLILKECQNLQSLNLDIKKDVFGDLTRDMSTMFSKLKKLEYLNLTVSARNFRFNCISSLPKSMKEISVKQYGSNNSSESFDLTQFCCLKTLSISGCSFAAKTFIGFENLLELSHLELSNCTIASDVEVADVQYLANLETLKINSTTIDEDIIVNILRNSLNLEHVCLSNVATLTDRSIESASTLPNLKVLELLWLHNISLNISSEMPLLKKLKCWGCDGVTDQALVDVIYLSPILADLQVKSYGITKDFLIFVNAAVRRRQNGLNLKVTTTKLKREFMADPEPLNLVLDINGDYALVTKFICDNYGPYPLIRTWKLLSAGLCFVGICTYIVIHLTCHGTLYWLNHGIVDVCLILFPLLVACLAATLAIMLTGCLEAYHS